MRVFQIESKDDSILLPYGASHLLVCRYVALQRMPDFTAYLDINELAKMTPAESFLVVTGHKETIASFEGWFRTIGREMKNRRPPIDYQKVIKISDPSENWGYEVACWPSAIQHTYASKGRHILNVRLAVSVWRQI